MPTLELIDVSAEEPVPTGDTATLDSNGKITYKGNGVKAILAPWVKEHAPEEVFRQMAGWSNGYVSLRER